METKCSLKAGFQRNFMDKTGLEKDYCRQVPQTEGAVIAANMSLAQWHRGIESTPRNTGNQEGIVH